MAVYYNENDKFAAEWLRRLIRRGLIADGEVDARSIAEVQGSDIAGFAQCHFFAGIGGWSYALRLAGWNDSRAVWTGSCPCQPFSVAGNQKGFADERHLWPQFKRLIAECRPATVFGEQVAAAAEWLRLVRSDLESLDYAVGAIPIEAASAGAYHKRDRYWFVAHSNSNSKRLQDSGIGKNKLAGIAGQEGNTIERPCGASCSMAHTDEFSEGKEREQRIGQQCGAGGDTETCIAGSDGKTRPVKSGLCLLAHGVSNRVGKLRGLGNAIDPRPAAAFIQAAM